MIHEYEIVVFNGRRYLVTAVLSSTEAVGIPMEVFSDEKQPICSHLLLIEKCKLEEA